jgi:hypothetical protein
VIFSSHQNAIIGFTQAGRGLPPRRLHPGAKFQNFCIANFHVSVASLVAVGPPPPLKAGPAWLPPHAIQLWAAFPPLLHLGWFKPPATLAPSLNLAVRHTFKPSSLTHGPIKCDRPLPATGLNPLFPWKGDAFGASVISIVGRIIVNLSGAKLVLASASTEQIRFNISPFA